MAWADQINLSELKVAVAPAGGPIAVMRDDKKFTPHQENLTFFCFHLLENLKIPLKLVFLH